MNNYDYIIDYRKIVRQEKVASIYRTNSRLKRKRNVVEVEKENEILFKIQNFLSNYVN